MKIKLVDRLQAWIEDDIGIAKSALVLLMTIAMLGTWMVFALSYYGGEIGLITKEEPRLAYLYCRDEIKNQLHLSDNKLLDNYLNAAIYPIQAHQYLVRIRLDLQTSSTAQADAYLPCTISAQPNGAWQVSEIKFKP